MATNNRIFPGKPRSERLARNPVPCKPVASETGRRMAETTTLEATSVATTTSTADPVAVATDAQEVALTLFQQLANFAVGLLRPWSAYQVAIIFGLIALTWLLARFIGPRFYNWIRSLEGRPKWQLRTLVILHQRHRLILFVILAWITVSVMREVTWPSRSYLIGLAATIATAMMLAYFASRLVQNRFLRRLLRWGLWTFAVIYYLGFWEATSDVLNALGFTVGEYRLSLLTALQAIVVTSLLFMGARFIANVTTAQVRRNEDISPSMQVLLGKVVQIVLYVAAFFVGLKAVGIDLTGLAFLSGAIGVGLGFGLQKVVSNLVSGFIILLDKSIKPGDVISLDDTFGWIQSLGARYVSVLTRNGTEFLIPNEDLITNRVVNWSHSSDLVRLDVHFGVSYDSDPHEVRKIASTAAASVARVIAVPAPVCHITGFGDSSVDFILRFWIKDPTQGLTNVRGAVFLALWDALKANRIDIPFPRRDVRILPSDAQPAVVND
jgi:small-conductance mechanosensitive channel